MNSKIKKSVNVFSLTMLNIATILTIKNWAFMAEYGFASLFFLLITMLLFFIPCGLVSAELAAAWPQLGGVYIWVKEAFGHRWGFLASWLLWLENVVWYPTILSFIVGTAFFALAPTLASHPFYTFLAVVFVMWALTAINLFGLRATSFMSEIGVLIGTFIPAILIITLGICWVIESGVPAEATHLASWLPDFQEPSQLAFLAGIFMSFGGIELSAVHAKDVENPTKNYPKAILISGVFIVFMTLLGVLAIAYATPNGQIDLTAGAIKAVSGFLAHWNLDRYVPLVAILMVVGAIGTVSSWIAGPTRALLAVATHGDLPPFFHKTNRFGMPVNIMITQAGIVTLLALVFVYLPSISASFWILNALAAQLYLLMYLLMFVAALVLRYKFPNIPRPYRVPFGNAGLWACCLTGIGASVFGILVGFLPPPELQTGSPLFYQGFLVAGILLVCIMPHLILIFKKKNWTIP